MICWFSLLIFNKNFVKTKTLSMLLPNIPQKISWKCLSLYFSFLFCKKFVKMLKTYLSIYFSSIIFRQIRFLSDKLLLLDKNVLCRNWHCVNLTKFLLCSNNFKQLFCQELRNLYDKYLLYLQNRNFESHFEFRIQR